VLGHLGHRDLPEAPQAVGDPQSARVASTVGTGGER
jgi:hypothetical protein